MASRKGNAKVTPALFSTALREICFFVINIGFLRLRLQARSMTARISLFFDLDHFEATSAACLRKESLLTIPKTMEDNL